MTEYFLFFFLVLVKNKSWSLCEEFDKNAWDKNVFIFDRTASSFGFYLSGHRAILNYLLFIACPFVVTTLFTGAPTSGPNGLYLFTFFISPKRKLRFEKEKRDFDRRNWGFDGNAVIAEIIFLFLIMQKLGPQFFSTSLTLP